MVYLFDHILFFLLLLSLSVHNDNRNQPKEKEKEPCFSRVFENQLIFYLLVTPPTKRIVILLCGSFNPVTIAHLRMFELARDYYHLRSIQVLQGLMINIDI
jgi:hypothetical protein